MRGKGVSTTLLGMFVVYSGSGGDDSENDEGRGCCALAPAYRERQEARDRTCLGQAGEGRVAHAGHAAQARERSPGAGSTPLYSLSILHHLPDPLSPGPAYLRPRPHARNTTMSGGAVRTTISRRHIRNNNASPYTRPSAKKSSVRGSISHLGTCLHSSLVWLVGVECHKFPQLPQPFYLIAF